MRMRLGFLLVAAATLGTAGGVHAQFTAGNLTVLRVGDGSAALGNGSTAVFLDQYLTIGSGQTPNFTVAVPTSGGTRLTNSGTATSEGQITRSADGTQIIVAGYDSATGTASIAGTTSATVNRVVNGVDVTGASTRLGTTATNFNANNIRSAYSNGTNAWAVGANSGTVVYPGDTAVSTTVANQRVVNSFNGNLYTTTSGATTSGVYQVGTGLPTGTGNTTSVVVSTVGSGTGTASPYAFAFNPAGTVAYIADDRNSTTVGGTGGGVQKWTGSGTTWTLAGTFSNFGQSSTTTIGTRGLAVDFSGTNPILYATTTDNRLVTVTDFGTNNFTDLFTVLATAGTNQAFRGVTFSPVPEPATVGLIGAAVLGAGAFVRRKLLKAGDPMPASA